EGGGWGGGGKNPPLFFPPPPAPLAYTDRKRLLGRPAVSPFAPIVLVADHLIQTGLFPFGVRFHLPLARPGGREDLGIVHRELVRDGVRVGPAKPLGRVKGVGVHPIFFRILVEPVIDRPSLVVSSLDRQRVAFPMSDRFSVERRFDIGFMRPAV